MPRSRKRLPNVGVARLTTTDDMEIGVTASVTEPKS